MLCVTLCLFILQVLAGPKLGGQRQASFTTGSGSGSNDGGKENGTDVSTGWVDPRINGGRFLDVRNTRNMLRFAMTLTVWVVSGRV